MRRLLHAAARLYPRAWRQRYGEELQALIDDVDPRWRDVVDIAIGALSMHVSRVSLTTLAAGLGLAGALAGAGYAFTRPPVYASSSRVLVSVPDAPASDNERGQRIGRVMRAALDLAALDTRNVVVTVRGNPGQDPMMLDMTASAASPEGARRAAERAITAVVSANLSAQERAPEERGVLFRVVEAPGLPTTGERKTVGATLIGAAAGVFAAAVIQLLIRLRRPRPASSS